MARLAAPGQTVPRHREESRTDQTLKLLTVLDAYTRECHALRVGRRLDSVAVSETLAELCGQHGAPGVRA
jgi:hypothetical protein